MELWCGVVAGVGLTQWISLKTPLFTFRGPHSVLAFWPGLQPMSEDAKTLHANQFDGGRGPDVKTGQSDEGPSEVEGIHRVSCREGDQELAETLSGNAAHSSTG